MRDSLRQAVMSLLTVLVLGGVWPWVSLPPARGSLPRAARAWVPTTGGAPCGQGSSWRHDGLAT
jgi:hypothetical protein